MDILNLFIFLETKKTKVDKPDTAKGLQNKLEEFYLVKSLPNKLFLLIFFSSFRIDPSKDLDDNLNTFNKLVLDIIKTKDKVSKKYRAVVILNIILKI